MSVVAPAAAPALAPLEAALAVVRRQRGPAGTGGLASGLVVLDDAGWIPAGDVVAGWRLDPLLDAAAARWRASPHAAAALAWRSYCYWLAMPAVLGWATARRVPRLTPDNVLVRHAGHEPFLNVGLRRPEVTVLPDDPLAGAPGATVVAGEEHLLAVLREQLRDEHLDPLLGQIRQRVRLGARTLLGSLASAVGYAAVRGLDRDPGEVTAVAGTVLSALDVADLVTIEHDTYGQPTVQRHTCCLAFTLPEPKICSGCCLRAPVPPGDTT